MAANRWLLCQRVTRPRGQRCLQRLLRVTQAFTGVDDVSAGADLEFSGRWHTSCGRFASFMHRFLPRVWRFRIPGRETCGIRFVPDLLQGAGPHQ